LYPDSYRDCKSFLGRFAKTTKTRFQLQQAAATIPNAVSAKGWTINNWRSNLILISFLTFE
jgi:hypothetical protein